MIESVKSHRDVIEAEKKSLNKEEKKLKKCGVNLLIEKRELVKLILGASLSEEEMEEDDLYIRMCREINLCSFEDDSSEEESQPVQEEEKEMSEEELSE